MHKPPSIEHFSFGGGSWLLALRVVLSLVALPVVLLLWTLLGVATGWQLVSAVMRHPARIAAAAVLFCLASGLTAVSAPPPHQHLDGRYAHDQYYYDHGFTLRRPPAGGLGNLKGRDGYRYWYDQGNWYRWNGGAWIVWTAPLGVFVPWLPPSYATIRWLGIPYYYANDTYYVWNDMEMAYQVVSPPRGLSIHSSSIVPAAPVSVPGSERGASAVVPSAQHGTASNGFTNTDLRLFAYPQNGQSEQLQARDRSECQHTAHIRSGFEPGVHGGGVPADQFVQKRAEYLRVQASCLEHRGYVVQ
jgi:hypothetical protein